METLTISTAQNYYWLQDLIWTTKGKNLFIPQRPGGIEEIKLERYFRLGNKDLLLSP